MNHRGGSPARIACVASAVVVAIALATGACAEDRPTCYRGDYRACPCDAGVAGLQACLSSQDGFGECVCGGPTPGLDAGDGG